MEIRIPLLEIVACRPLGTHVLEVDLLIGGIDRCEGARYDFYRQSLSGTGFPEIEEFVRKSLTCRLQISRIICGLLASGAIGDEFWTSVAPADKAEIGSALRCRTNQVVSHAEPALQARRSP